MREPRTPDELDLEIKELTRGTENLLYEGSPTVQHLTTHKPIPGMRIYDSNGKMYIVDLHGQAVPVSVAKIDRPLKKERKFYHQPIPSGVHTPPEVLLQQHAEMMEQVNYDTFMNLSTSGRFGKWDTTLSIHNSSNNSRESKNSRGSVAEMKKASL